MHDYQREFLDLALARDALRFGRFTLKSGRESPYFFNAGPAYKGIPLAAAAAIALAREHGRNVPWAFNRKEAKDHGEGGHIVGHRLEGRVLIVDDVITAGTAVRESVALIRGTGARPVGIALALDRQERGQGERSAVQEVEAEFGLTCLSILSLAGLIEALAGAKGDALRISGEHRAALEGYRRAYGVA